MDPELTILLPCLNEAETLAECIRQAHAGARAAEAGGYEILVADNGSTDGSAAVAAQEGARVVQVPVRGYGSALMDGIRAARGRFVIMGDADGSYDFGLVPAFVERLRAGDQLVMGTRLRGTILPGAMPPLHRYLGNPVLTWIGNVLFRSGLSDFHCGLRGFARAPILSLGLRTLGMEFASEMVIRASLGGLRVSEIPITYYPDKRSRSPHLRTWRDGWRHLSFMLLYSPRWVFLYPGTVLSLLGLIGTALLLLGPVRIGHVVFDVSSLMAFSTVALVGLQLILLGFFARVYAARMGLLPRQARLETFLDRFSLGYGLLAGAAIILTGTAVLAIGVSIWGRAGFGTLDYERILRVVIPGALLVLAGVQILFSSFVLSLLGIRHLPDDGGQEHGGPE